MYFSTITRKNGFKKDRSARDLSADRCFLLSMPYFFVFAGAAGIFLLGYWAWYCNKFLQKNDMLLQAFYCWVHREIRALFTQACTIVTRLDVCCLITRQRSWFKFHRITRTLVMIEKDWSYLVLTRLCTSSKFACRQTQLAYAFTKTASSALSNSFSRASAFTLADNLT